MSFTDYEPLGLLSVLVSPVCYLRIIPDYIPNRIVRLKRDTEFNCNQGKRINMQWAPAMSWTLSIISFSYYSCKVSFSLCNWVQPKAQRAVTPQNKWWGSDFHRVLCGPFHYGLPSDISYYFWDSIRSQIWILVLHIESMLSNLDKRRTGVTYFCGKIF